MRVTYRAGTALQNSDNGTRGTVNSRAGEPAAAGRGERPARRGPRGERWLPAPANCRERVRWGDMAKRAAQRKGKRKAKAKGPARLPMAERVCRAAVILAQGQTVQAAAEAVRARPATIHAWATGADFRALRAALADQRRVRDALDRLGDLTLGAIEVLRRALEGDDMALAIRAAREVLERIGPLAKGTREQTIRVEYVNRDGQAVSTAPWAARHSAAPGKIQGGRVRTALREDGDGEDSAG